MIRQSGGLEILEIKLRYLITAAPQLEEDALRRAVVQALPEGERIMATIAEKWVQQGLQQGLQLPGIRPRRYPRAVTQHASVMRASSPFVGLRRA